MKRSQTLQINKEILKFFDDYVPCLYGVTSKIQSFEDYVNSFVDHFKGIVPITFQDTSHYSPEIIKKYKDRVIMVSQSLDMSKHGFLNLLVQISPDFHLLMRCIIDWHEDQIPLVSVMSTMISFSTIKLFTTLFTF